MGTECTDSSATVVVFEAIGVFYMFLGLALVCDEFFVPALEVLADNFGLSADVAGATLMAAGGSAPELFTSLIGTFQRSDVGFGTIVGSAVFNVLFVIAACTVASPGPLRLTKWPVARDMTCYLIALLFVALFFVGISPGEICWWEAVILFLLYICYITVMAHNEQLHEYFTGRKIAPAEEEKDVEMKNLTEEDANAKVTEDGEENVPQRKNSRRKSMNALSFRAGLSTIVRKGKNLNDLVSMSMVSQVVGDVTQTFEHIDTDHSGYIDLQEFKTAMNDLGLDVNNEDHVKEIYDSINANTASEGISLEKFSDWYLKSQDRMIAEARDVFDMFASKSEPTDRIFKTDIKLVIEELLGASTVNKNAAELETLTEMITADDDNADSLAYEQFLEWYKNSLFWEKKKSQFEQEAETAEGVDLSLPWGEAWDAWAWYIFTFPYMALFWLTIPDVRVSAAGWRGMKPYIAFILSILYIGILSFFMVRWAEDVGYALGVPTVVMGLTILAAGTSVPDLLSSVIVAKMGEGDMAVSSSIGSNIFDVLIGLPVPWFLFNVIKWENVQIDADNLMISIFVLILMLVAVLVTLYACEWTMNKSMGVIMILFYGIFVAQDLLRADYDKVGCTTI